MKYSFITAILLFSVQAFSWGSLGHKTSAEIAWQFLDRETQIKAQELLGETTFANASTWADSIRSDKAWDGTMWYHFEKIPDDVTYLENLRGQSNSIRLKGGLIEALYIAEDALKSPRANIVDKQNALKFMIHFIGDMHQPLHTGRVEDNGGNKVNIRWLGRDTSLHSVWDSQIIYVAHEQLLATAGGNQPRAYAEYLMKKYKNFQPTPDMFARYDEWMHESMVPRADAYEYKDESNGAYAGRFVDVIDERVFLAGLRIAYTTRRMLNRTSTQAPMARLRSAIVQIVGDFTTFVSLKPKTSH